MKSFKTYLSEAVATRKKPTPKERSEFRDKFATIKSSDAYTNANKMIGTHSWHLTGHNADTEHGTTSEIEAMKQKVFGKRRKGTSDLFWLHHNHGLITHPAIGDVTHGDVQDHMGHGQRKRIKVNKKIQAKVKEGGIGAIIGQGRIEHHEGGGGIISYAHASVMSPRSAAVRTIARAYPKYKIHDGQGNLLEGYTTTKDGWLHSRGLGRRRWMKGSHSIERQGKRGWTVYDWHANKELHVAKTARDAKAWSEKNRSTAAPTHEPIKIRLFENWSYAHDFDDMPNSEKQKYVYHVTTAARAAKIVKGGLKPRSPKGRTNYPGAKEHTQGHAFVTNHQGVRYWKDQTAHAVNRRKREVDERDYENIHVIKFPIANLPKSTRRKLRVDPLGTKDSRRHDDEPMIDPSSHEGSTALMTRKKIREEWSEKYKRSIDCSNPRGFSQRAHCQGKKKLNEEPMHTFLKFIIEQKKDRIQDFVDFASEYLGLQQEPQIEFLDVREEGMTTASYCPADAKIKIYTTNRANFDICRSIAHEMVHQMQCENEEDVDGTTGSPHEDEANALAGRIIRLYGERNPEFYE
jgi:hypothetical protein